MFITGSDSGGGRFFVKARGPCIMKESSYDAIIVVAGIAGLTAVKILDSLARRINYDV